MIRVGMVLLLFGMLGFAPLKAECSRPPLLTIGGGYYDAGPNHSGGLGQIEYRFVKSYFNYIRPVAALVLPRFCSMFLGVGVSAELFMSEKLIFIPSFMPGYYYQGGGRDLGYPIEFRSCLEVAYEWCSGVRFGGQFFHISNASLSDRNPGANAALFYLALPLAF